MNDLYSKQHALISAEIVCQRFAHKILKPNAQIWPRQGERENLSLQMYNYKNMYDLPTTRPK